MAGKLCKVDSIRIRDFERGTNKLDNKIDDRDDIDETLRTKY